MAAGAMEAAKREEEEEDEDEDEAEDVEDNG